MCGAAPRFRPNQSGFSRGRGLALTGRRGVGARVSSLRLCSRLFPGAPWSRGSSCASRRAWALPSRVC